MTRYLIHIGPHKTGSTYLQNTLVAQAEFLRAQGILYPADLGRIGHASITRKLADPARHAELAGQLEGYAAESGIHTVVLSAEDLASLRQPGVEALAGMIGYHDVEIVFYCRGWVDVSCSNWGEQVRRGYATPLDASLRQRFEAPELSAPINYGLALGRYARAFGAETLRLVSLQALAQAGRDTAEHFATSFLALPPPPPGERLPPRVRNPALPLAEAEIIRAFNAMHLERTNERSGAMRRALQRRRGLPKHLQASRRAIAAHLGNMIIDETAGPLWTLHDHLFETYGARLVSPRPSAGFFAPRRHEVAFVGQDYLSLPEVQQELETAYTILRATRTEAVQLLA